MNTLTTVLLVIYIVVSLFSKHGRKQLLAALGVFVLLATWAPGTVLTGASLRLSRATVTPALPVLPSSSATCTVSVDVVTTGTGADSVRGTLDNVDGDGASGYGHNGTLDWPTTWTTSWVGPWARTPLPISTIGTRTTP